LVEIAGAAISAAVDGQSLVPLMHGHHPPRWRTVALVEHHHGPEVDKSDPDAPAPRSGNPPTYEAIRSRDFLYVEYDDGEREHYDIAADPNELHNNFAAVSAPVKNTLHETLTAVKNCRGSKSCQAAERPTETLAKPDNAAR
jgi:hypothetical protein